MILAIGGSGFVGSRLLNEFESNEFKNLDKNQSPFFQNNTYIHDIRDLSGLDKFFKDVTHVILLAAEHRDDVNPKSLYYDVNVKGTKNVLDAMDKYGIKNLIFTSSVAIYGLNKNNPSETHIPDPFNDYGISKWQAEQLIEEWYENDPIKKSVTVIRPTVIFGERNRGNVYNLLKQISSGRFLMIGKGKNKKSMTYVGNVVAFIMNRIKVSDLGYHVFNFSDKPDLDMNELVSLIENKLRIKTPGFKIPYFIGLSLGYMIDFFSFLIQKKLPISSVRVKKFCATTQFNSVKAKNIFNSPYTLEEGLNKTIENEFINPKKDKITFYSK